MYKYCAKLKVFVVFFILNLKFVEGKKTNTKISKYRTFSTHHFMMKDKKTFGKLSCEHTNVFTAFLFFQSQKNISARTFI